MTKEVEVGDQFKGKVVKTTTFGAFVELTKGTDGLLHISNVKPGERVDTVEDVLSSGDEIDVTAVEVDRERGRIGLRLSDDPAIEGKSPEELATRRHRRPRPEARRRRARARWTRRAADAGGASAAAATAGDAGAAERRTPAASFLPGVELIAAARRHPGRDRERAIRCARSPSGSGCGPGRATRPRRRRGCRTFSSTCSSRAPSDHSAIEISEIFDGLGASVNAATSKESTHLHARFLDAHTERAFEVLSQMLLGPDLRRDRLRARGRAGGDRDVRGRAAGPRPRRPRRGGLRRSPARPPRARPGAR